MNQDNSILRLDVKHTQYLCKNSVNVLFFAEFHDIMQAKGGYDMLTYDEIDCCIAEYFSLSKKEYGIILSTYDGKNLFL